MVGIRYENDHPYIWCVWCCTMVRADLPHECKNPTMFRMDEKK